jgi:hypothetical protein
VGCDVTLPGLLENRFDAGERDAAEVWGGHAKGLLEGGTILEEVIRAFLTLPPAPWILQRDMNALHITPTHRWWWRHF